MSEAIRMNTSTDAGQRALEIACDRIERLLSEPHADRLILHRDQWTAVHKVVAAFASPVTPAAATIPEGLRDRRAIGTLPDTDRRDLLARVNLYFAGAGCGGLQLRSDLIDALAANEPEGDERARLKSALAELTDCFLEKHGCFPLDNKRWNAAMSEAYALIGQPGTQQRIAALANNSPIPPATIPGGDREAVARIVDPDEWALHDLGMAKDPPVASMFISRSLAKADEILAALTSTGEASDEVLADAGGDVPVDMLLFCPMCGIQHVDWPDERTPGWSNPPHRSHLCHGCGCIWRPADVPTNGVAAIATHGKADTWGESNSAALANPVTVDAGGVGELVEMLRSADVEEGCTVFNHTPEEFGLFVMENHTAILAALVHAAPVAGEEAK